MAINRVLRPKTVIDINGRVERILRGLGNPEPPLDLAQVRELLNLDREFYTSNDPGVLQEAVSRIRVAGVQIYKRPAILLDVIKKFNLRALYIPDQKRILLDSSQPKLKHRWNEAHEVGHSILPWHEETMLGDHANTLSLACHDQIEAEANFVAGRLLFLQERFTKDAMDCRPAIQSILTLKPVFGNTITTTFWRCIEVWGRELPVVGLISKHPHVFRQSRDFDAEKPCAHYIESHAFGEQFSNVDEMQIFPRIQKYCEKGNGHIPLCQHRCPVN